MANLFRNGSSDPRPRLDVNLPCGCKVWFPDPLWPVLGKAAVALDDWDRRQLTQH